VTAPPDPGYDEARADGPAPVAREHAPFDSRADDYQDQLQQGLRLSGESKEHFARARLAHLRRWWGRTARPEPARILDYGCGVGDVALLLAEAFPRARVLGADPSPRFIEQASRELGSERVSFVRLDGYSALDAEPADLVHLNGVVHHVPPAERGPFFAALARAVRPGGVVALFDNNPLNPGTRAIMRRIPFDRGCDPVPAGGVRAGLEAAGLRVLQTRFLFWFPAALRALRPLERGLERVPLGAQYAHYAERPRRG